MLPTPGRDDAALAVARVRRIADDARCRRLDALEKLWKGVPEDGLPSFWDTSVPLHERAPCVCSGLPEAAGGRLVALVFGESRFPTLTAAASPWAPAPDPAAAARLTALVAAVVKRAKLRGAMRELLRQGLMTGTALAFVRVRRGRLEASPFAAKWATPTFDAAGDLEAIEVRYRFSRPGDDGRDEVCWYRRVLDRQAETTYAPAPVDPHGYEPEWTPETVVAHGLGFVPALWHRHSPDASDLDPIDGTAMFAGLEDELRALDMALSQRHRNARYNGEPQMVRIGAGEQRLGAPGREAEARSGAPKGWTYAVGSAVDGVRRWLLGGAGGGAVQKGPNRIWDLPSGADAKLLESSGAGAQILAADVDGLRRAILEARSIVLASPETVGANASAALLKAIFEPTTAIADGLREEYGDVLCELVSLVLRVALHAHAAGGFVALDGLAAAAPDLLACYRPTAAGPVWTGVPLDLAWGEYFEPTWADVQAAVTAASLGAGNRAVLTLEQAVRLVAKVAGSDDVAATLAALRAEDGEAQAATHAVMGALGGHAPPPFGDPP